MDCGTSKPASPGGASLEAVELENWVKQALFRAGFGHLRPGNCAYRSAVSAAINGVVTHGAVRRPGVFPKIVTRIRGAEHRFLK
jgi:hypothetical protein